MFRGRKHLNMDTKGRMAMPAKFRERIFAASEGQMVITIDRSLGCLLIYPLVEWEKLEEKLAALSSTNKKIRGFKRFILHNAEEVEMDAQGRFVVPPRLRDYAKLEKSVVLAGEVNKLELWDEAAYEEEQQGWADLEEGLPDELADLAF